MQDIVEGKSVGADIVDGFTFSSSLNQDGFLSLLFYLGLLTIKGSDQMLAVALGTPNYVIRDVYYKYFMEYLRIDEKKKRDAVGRIAFENDFSAFNALVAQAMQMHSNSDFIGFDEARLKSVFLSCLSDQKVYLIKSEYESNGKKPDIALLDIRGGKTSVQYNYLIELKYIKKSESSEAKIKEKIQEQGHR